MTDKKKDIQELSKPVLGRYVRKAALDIRDKSGDVERTNDLEKKKQMDSKVFKRIKGIRNASQKLEECFTDNLEDARWAEDPKVQKYMSNADRMSLLNNKSRELYRKAVAGAAGDEEQLKKNMELANEINKQWMKTAFALSVAQRDK